MDEPAPTGETFDRWRGRLGLALGPVLAVVAWWASQGGPAPKLAGLMALCVTWWLSEALPTAAVGLLAAVGAVLTGLATPDAAFAAFGYPLLFLFIGSFFIAEAMKVHGLGDRLAAAIRRRARGRMSLLTGIALASFVLSTMMSNSAATAIVLPIALSAAMAVRAAGVPDREGRRFSAAMVLAVAWGASVGGLATPVGTPPNLIGLGELRANGIDLDFFTWMLFGVPIGLVTLAGMLLVLCTAFGVRRGQAIDGHAAAAPPPWSAGERSALAAALLALLGWTLPTIVGLAAPGSAVAKWMEANLTEEIVGVTAGGLLFILPGGTRGARRPALTWSEATRIDWGIILLFGGGVLLGRLAKQTGLATAWGTWLVDATGAGSTWSIVALVTAVSIVLSEATSNTATATLMAPLAAGLAHAAGAATVPAVLGATLGASFGFMMPISTAPNAMAYATGQVTIGQMARAGIVFDLVGFVLVVGGLRVICPLLGWW